MNDLLSAADFSRNGNLPAAGGVFDQTPYFLRACRFVLGEQNRLMMPGE